MKRLFIVLIILFVLIGGFSMDILGRSITDIQRRMVGQTDYRINVVKGVVATVNINRTFGCYIAGETVIYPSIPTFSRDPKLEIGDKVTIEFINGCRETPVILAPEDIRERPDTTLPVTGDLIACDTENHTIWKFDGISNTIKETLDVISVVYWPTAATIANGNLVTFGYAVAHGYDYYICVHDGFSTTITEYIVPPEGILNSNISALYFDGTNLISMDSTTKKIYIHSGISASISSSFSTPSTLPRGMVIVGSDLITVDADSDKIYIHNGITASIKSSFDCITPDNSTYGQPAPNGLTNDGTNLILGDNGAYKVVDDSIIFYDGKTSTITSQRAAPAGCKRICGLAYFK